MLPLRSAVLIPLIAILTFPATSSWAGIPFRHVKAAKAEKPIILDGNPASELWRGAPQVTGFTDFSTGAVAADQTLVSVLYDEHFLYFQFDCHDAQPATVTARETVRDSKFNSNGPNNTEDNVEVDLDPFFTKSYSDLSRFSVNAIGTRSAAIAGGRGSKAEWKGDWDAVSKRTPTGWVCQIRIPWATFHYPSSNTPVNLGINFTRYSNRTRVMSEWSSTGPQGFLDREGVWEGVQLPREDFHPKLSLLPYALGGIESPGGIAGKAGLDARYTITPRLTAVGTLFPDFSNIEGSVASIAFSHGAHYVQETRPFFTEGGNDFGSSINFNDIGSEFYSTAIPQFDAGAKVYGKLTPNDTIGALDTISFGNRDDFAARLQHTFNATTTGGAMVVSSANPFESSTVFSGDGHTRFGKLGLEGEVLGSSGPGAGGGAELASLSYSDKKVTSDYQFSEISNDFSAPDGYYPYTGYKGFFGLEDYTNTWRTGYWRSAEITGVGIAWNGLEGSQYYEGGAVDYNMSTKTDLLLDLNYNRFQFEGLPDNYIQVTATQGITNRFRQYGLQLLEGVEGGAKTTAFGPVASFRVLKKLDLSYQGLIQNRLGVTQQHVLTANYELTPTRSFGGRVVTENSATNLYFFYHNSGGKGADLYVLFGDPDAFKTVASLQVKVVFAL
jgi:hypothetical protein